LHAYGALSSIKVTVFKAEVFRIAALVDAKPGAGLARKFVFCFSVGSSAAASGQHD